MLVLTVVLSVAVGAALGMLGGGGTILLVPLLTYVTGRSAEESIGTSLVVVLVTSLVAAVPHARAGRVKVRAAVVFGAFGTLGAFLGGRLAEWLPPPAQLSLFGLVMLASGVAMELRRAPAVEREPRVGPLVASGIGVGTLTGLVGAGGGFLAVPALALLGGMPFSTAAPTALLVIAMNSAAGLAARGATLDLDPALVVVVTLAAVAGSVGGGLLAPRVSQRQLRRAFALLVCTLGALVVSHELPRAVGLEVALGGQLALFAAIAVALVLVARAAPIPGDRPGGTTP